MEAWLETVYAEMHWSLLGVVIAASLYSVGKAADWLVDKAVELSERSHLPKMVVGATVVSLGTTMPEAAVSVLAAVDGVPGLALGNAVGSIICDTGLILGIACLIAPLKLERRIVNRQGWLQLAAGVGLVAVCFPWGDPGAALSVGGRMPQWTGWLFLALLAAYLYQSIQWARQDRVIPQEIEEEHGDGQPVWLVVLQLFAAIAVVIVSAQVLIPAVDEAAQRMAVPESIIAGTLVAFGTSLPELVTAITAARRGHGELAVGNVIGADILNALFVAGAAAAVTPEGLAAAPQFFQTMFPVMLFILLVFRVGVVFSGDSMRRPFGYVLLAAYGVYLVVSYAFLDSLPGGH